MDGFTMHQIRKETYRQMQRQLERKMWRSGVNGSKFSSLTGNSSRDPDGTGELMDSFRTLEQTMRKEAQGPPEPAVPWEAPDVDDYTDHYQEQWHTKMTRMAVFDGARLAMLTSLRKHIVDERAMLMRRTADVHPDLLRTAEIRALTEPS